MQKTNNIMIISNKKNYDKRHANGNCTVNTPKPSNKPKDQYPVRLRSPKDEDELEFMFLGDEFSEILSILAEPDDETSDERVDQLLTQLGLLSNRPTSNQKFRVLLSSLSDTS